MDLSSPFHRSMFFGTKFSCLFLWQIFPITGSEIVLIEYKTSFEYTKCQDSPESAIHILFAIFFSFICHQNLFFQWCKFMFFEKVFHLYYSSISLVPNDLIYCNIAKIRIKTKIVFIRLTSALFFCFSRNCTLLCPYFPQNWYWPLNWLNNSDFSIICWSDSFIFLKELIY